MLAIYLYTGILYIYYAIRVNAYMPTTSILGPMSALSSTATFASPKTRSLRATIPEGIVAYLGIGSGDKLEWRMEIVNGQKVVFVRKADEEE
jgi:hypothetical protein